jgi:hypothetical protein
MDELPTSPVGKVLKRELRKEMQAEEKDFYPRGKKIG